MISVNNLSVEFSAHPLFTDISFVINPSDKIALVGKNGAGKSTMLKILAGLQNPTSGSIGKPNDLTIGYLPQQMKLADETTVFEETRKAFRHRSALEEELHNLNSRLESATNLQSEEYQKLFDRLEYLNDRIAMDGTVNVEAEIEKTLIGLGFSRNDLDRPTSEFSGGWRMRVELAKILLQRPDVLLLDEPTNHLDIESIQWLEQFMATKAKAVVLVSHDRAFLDNVTKRTIEINCGRIYDYKVSYTPFVKLRDERLEQQMRAYENQQKLIADIKAFIDRFRYQATKAIQVQSRIKQLEKIVPIEVDEVDTSHLRLKFPPAPRSGDFPLIVDGLSKSYGDHVVFSDAAFSLRRGDKVAFVGKNGEGKSTLVKCIMGEIPFDGHLKLGHNVKIGYFAQNQAQLLDESITVFDNVATGDMRTKIRDILGAFMFGGEAADKKVKVLSGGEKTRLAMIKLLLEPVNFLILDEPTNHLDMRTKDVLKEAIKAFDGTVIVVSHDREFLDGLVDKVYEFGGGKVKENLGGIYDFLQKKKMENLNELEKGNPRMSQAGSPSLSNVNLNSQDSIQETEKQARQLSYAEQKEQEKLIRKAEKAVKIAEEKIAELEHTQSELEDRLATGDASSETLASYSEVKTKLDVAMEEWENAQREYDELIASCS